MAIKPAGRGPEVVAVYTFFVSLTTLAIALRVYCRAIIVKNLGVDDWLAVVAWIFFCVFAGFAITGAHHGTGQHANLIIPPTEIPIGLKWWWACEPIYVLANMALKFSIAVMLHRLTVLKLHKIIIWVTTCVVELYSAFFFFLFILQCRPSAYFWTQYTGGKGTCIDPQITVNATYGFSAVSCAGDWILAILPVFLVWNLQMNPRTKISVALILSMGAIASTATIIRIPYVSSLANQADFLYATTDVAIWSACETGIGIAACSIATLRPVFRSFFARNRLFGSSSHKVSNPWPSNSGPSSGYVRSRSNGAVEEYGLHSDINKIRGVVTVIESGNDGSDLERGEGGIEKDKRHRGVSGSGKGGERQFRAVSEWSNNESKLTLDRSSEEGEIPWGSGIRKTIVHNRTIN